MWPSVRLNYVAVTPTLFARYPYVHASFDSLTMADVRLLLQQYKQLVLRFATEPQQQDAAAAGATGAGGPSSAVFLDASATSGSVPAARGGNNALATCADGGGLGPVVNRNSAPGTGDEDGRSAGSGSGSGNGISASSNAPQPEAPDDGSGPPFHAHVCSPYFEHIRDGKKVGAHWSRYLCVYQAHIF